MKYYTDNYTYSNQPQINKKKSFNINNINFDIKSIPNKEFISYYNGKKIIINYGENKEIILNLKELTYKFEGFQRTFDPININFQEIFNTIGENFNKIYIPSELKEKIEYAINNSNKRSIKDTGKEISKKCYNLIS